MRRSRVAPQGPQRVQCDMEPFGKWLEEVEAEEVA